MLQFNIQQINLIYFDTANGQRGGPIVLLNLRVDRDDNVCTLKSSNL